MAAEVNTLVKKPAKNIHRRVLLKNTASAYIYVLPALFIYGLLTFYPMIKTVIYSFQQVNLVKSSVWVGLDNYIRMIGNPLFGIAWKNIFEFMALSILMGFMVPIILGMMINELGRLGKFFQTMVYLPSLIPIAVALLVWRRIYTPEGGILNSILKAVGMHAQLWLQNPDLAKPSMVVIMTWLGAGGSVLIYLSALKEIPPELYEAAELDGFSPLQRVWYLTLPLLSSRMQIMLVLQIITVAQIFNEPFILTSGGPANSTPDAGSANLQHCFWQQ